jgi:hypothetical protein
LCSVYLTRVAQIFTALSGFVLIKMIVILAHLLKQNYRIINDAKIKLSLGIVEQTIFIPLLGICTYLEVEQLNLDETCSQVLQGFYFIQICLFLVYLIYGVFEIYQKYAYLKSQREIEQRRSRYAADDNRPVSLGPPQVEIGILNFARR